MASALKEPVPRDKWWQWRWFSPDDTKEERRLITKIDLLLVPYSVLGYWVKYNWSNALSSVFHGWVNNLLRDSPEERSFTLVLINLLSQSSTARTPLLTFPTVEAPRYRKGFSFCLGCAIALITVTWIMHYYLKRDKRQATGSADKETSSHDSSGVITSVDGDTKKVDDRINEVSNAGQGEKEKQADGSNGRITAT